MAQIFVSPWAQYTDASGNPGSGDKLYFYATGTTTPSTIYSDVGLTTPQANPAIADSAGQWPAIYLADTLYKVVMTTAADVTIRTVDPVFSVVTGSKGADLPSATALDVGSTGDYFHVTGTTSITSITTRVAGTRITLEFDGKLTMAHNGVSLILPDAANILTHAGYIAEFISEGSGNWRCSQWVEITPWTAYTPTFVGFGIVSGVTCYSRRVGSNLEVFVTASSGTCTAVTASMTLGFNGTNSNVVINSTVMPTSAGKRPVVGILNSDAAASTTYFGSYVIIDVGVSTGLVYFSIVSSTTRIETAATGTAVQPNNKGFCFSCSVPISAWG